MAQKKKAFLDALAESSPEPANTAHVPAAAEPSATNSKLPPSRQGKANIATWLPKAVKYELDELRVKRSRDTGRNVTTQELMAEALNDLFKKYGRAEVAPTIDN